MARTQALWESLQPSASFVIVVAHISCITSGIVRVILLPTFHEEARSFLTLLNTSNNADYLGSIYLENLEPSLHPTGYQDYKYLPTYPTRVPSTEKYVPNNVVSSPWYTLLRYTACTEQGKNHGTMILDGVCYSVRTLMWAHIITYGRALL